MMRNSSIAMDSVTAGEGGGVGGGRADTIAGAVYHHHGGFPLIDKRKSPHVYHKPECRCVVCVQRRKREGKEEMDPMDYPRMASPVHRQQDAVGEREDAEMREGGGEGMGEGGGGRSGREWNTNNNNSNNNNNNSNTNNNTNNSNSNNAAAGRRVVDARERELERMASRISNNNSIHSGGGGGGRCAPSSPLLPAHQEAVGGDRGGGAGGGNRRRDEAREMELEAGDNVADVELEEGGGCHRVVIVRGEQGGVIVEQSKGGGRGWEMQQAGGDEQQEEAAQVRECQREHMRVSGGGERFRGVRDVGGVHPREGGGSNHGMIEYGRDPPPHSSSGGHDRGGGGGGGRRTKKPRRMDTDPGTFAGPATLKKVRDIIHADRGGLHVASQPAGMVAAMPKMQMAAAAAVPPTAAAGGGGGGQSEEPEARAAEGQEEERGEEGDDGGVVEGGVSCAGGGKWKARVTTGRDHAREGGCDGVSEGGIQQLGPPRLGTLIPIPREFQWYREEKGELPDGRRYRNFIVRTRDGREKFAATAMSASSKSTFVYTSSTEFGQVTFQNSQEAGGWLGVSIRGRPVEGLRKRICMPFEHRTVAAEGVALDQREEVDTRSVVPAPAAVPTPLPVLPSALAAAAPVPGAVVTMETEATGADQQHPDDNHNFQFDGVQQSDGLTTSDPGVRAVQPESMATDQPSANAELNSKPLIRPHRTRTPTPAGEHFRKSILGQVVGKRGRKPRNDLIGAQNDHKVPFRKTAPLTKATKEQVRMRWEPVKQTGRIKRLRAELQELLNPIASQVAFLTEEVCILREKMGLEVPTGAGRPDGGARKGSWKSPVNRWQYLAWETSCQQQKKVMALMQSTDHSHDDALVELAKSLAHSELQMEVLKVADTHDWRIAMEFENLASVEPEWRKEKSKILKKAMVSVRARKVRDRKWKEKEECAGTGAGNTLTKVNVHENNTRGISTGINVEGNRANDKYFVGAIGPEEMENAPSVMSMERP